MGDISANFSRSEFACECGCGFDAVDKELVGVLETARAHFSRILGSCKVVISGPNRCESHNRAVGGSENSYHVKGMAADHYFVGPNGTRVPPTIVANYYRDKYPDKYGIGKYDNRTHLDVRPYRADWDATTK